MTDNQKQGATPSISESRLAEMLSVLLSKEAKLAEKEAMLEQQMKARDEERKLESQRYIMDRISVQMNCRHLKGGKGKSKRQQKDPAVYLHTFTDGKSHIKCQLCGAIWKPGDTAEHFLRNGDKIDNWTGIGWREATEMVEDSSNKPSSSERFFKGYNEEAVEQKVHSAAKSKNLQL
jgi:hypothetical protein